MVLTTYKRNPIIQELMYVQTVSYISYNITLNAFVLLFLIDVMRNKLRSFLYIFALLFLYHPISNKLVTHYDIYVEMTYLPPTYIQFLNESCGWTACIGVQIQCIILLQNVSYYQSIMFFSYNLIIDRSIVTHLI